MSNLFLVEFFEKPERRPTITVIDDPSVSRVLAKFKCQRHEVVRSLHGFQADAGTMIADDLRGWSAHVIYAGY